MRFFSFHDQVHNMLIQPKTPPSLGEFSLSDRIVWSNGQGEIHVRHFMHMPGCHVH